MNTKWISIAGKVFSVLVSLIFIGTGVSKFTGGEANMQTAELVGSETTLYILGAMQIVFAILFLIPRTAVVGFLLMATYMAGAMATHLILKESLVPQTGIEVLIWVAGFLRLPELRQRLCGKCQQ